MLSSIWNDLRYAVRSLGRSPGFIAAAVATIALGIGINVGVFTVLNGLLFRELPAPGAHQLVSMAQTVEGGQFTGTAGVGTSTLPEYLAYRDDARTLSGLVAYGNPIEVTLGGPPLARDGLASSQLLLNL